jgi:hypothetical protein
MTGVTLDRLDERTEAHGLAIEALKVEVKGLWRIVYWGSGACFGFGVVVTLLVPKISKLLGLS